MKKISSGKCRTSYNCAVMVPICCRAWSPATVPGTSEALAQRELQFLGCTPRSRTRNWAGLWLHPWEVHSGQGAEFPGKGALGDEWTMQHERGQTGDQQDLCRDENPDSRM